MMGGGIRALNTDFWPADPYNDEAMHAFRRDCKLPEKGLLIGNLSAYDRFDQDCLKCVCEILIAVDGDDCGLADQKFCGKYCCADRIIFAPFIDADPPWLLTLKGGN